MSPQEEQEKDDDELHHSLLMASSLQLLFEQANALMETSSHAEALPVLETLTQQIRREAVFSLENETMDDVNTEDLKLLLAEQLLGLALVRSSTTASPPLRLAKLQQARAHFEKFLFTCRQMEAFRGHDKEEETEKQFEERTAKGLAYVGPTREVKIARYKEQKQIQDAIAAKTKAAAKQDDAGLSHANQPRSRSPVRGQEGNV
jgi:hypothetical protein